MLTRTFSFLAIMAILFTSSFIPFSYASVESEAQEDLMAGCRDDQSLVYRSTYLDFICVDPTTAERWAELGIAEIVQNSTSTEKDESEIDIASYEEKYPGAPPPPPEKSSEVNYTSECRDGQVLIYQFSYRDTICANMFTALTWERLGMAEIVEKSISEQDDEFVEVSIDSSSENIVATTGISDIEELETVMEEELETVMEEELETVMEEELETVMEEESKYISYVPPVIIDSDLYPVIRGVEKNIYRIIDSDGSTGFLIEGNSGVIAIDSLSSHSSSKEIIDEFQTVSNNKIKAVILTNISPETIFALEAYGEYSDGTVDIIISEDLLQQFETTHDTKVKNTIPFSDSLSVNIAELNLEIFVNDKDDTYQTFIYFQDSHFLIVSDSEYGLYPFIIDVSPLSDLLIEELTDDSENDL